MKEYIVFIFFFTITMFQSQINIDYSVVSHKENYQLKINITNTSDDHYLLPFDITGFKAYYEFEYCGDFDDQDYPYKFFAPTVMLKEENTTDYLLPGSSRGHMPEGEGAEQYIKDLQAIASKQLKEIDNWKKKYHLRSYKDALKNYYITKNLLFLKPHEKYSYEIPLDLGTIARTSTSTLYDYYYLKFAKYDLSLHLCITTNAYNWLTKQQKKELRKYKLFKGVIKSNSYRFKAYE